jgi:hydrogenase-4 component B
MLDQNIISTLVFAALALPIAAGVFGLFGKNSKAANAVVGAANMLGAILGAVAAAGFLFFQDRGLFLGDAPHIILLARVLSIDMLSAYFLLLISVGVFLVSWFSIFYLPRYKEQYRFPWLHIATALFIFGMELTVVSNTPLLFLLAWETMSFAAYFLVIADRKAESIKAGFSYVIMTQLGAACLIAGFAILSQGNMNAFLSQLPGGSGTAGLVGAILLLIGFGAKAGIFPFHEWLPEAHPQAPSSASALMSGVMLKVALYGTLRALLTVMHFSLPLPVILVFIALALFTAFYGALMASVETDLKRTLAWSSVENMGVMFLMAATVTLFVGLGMMDAAGAVWVALFVFAFCHMLFKSGLFMAAGTLISQTHTRDLDLMGGLAKKWPAFSGWFMALALCAAALPPAGTFFGEWIFLTTVGSAVRTGVVTGLVFMIIVSIFALSAGLAAFAMVKVFAAAFLAKPRSEHAEHVKKMPFSLYAPAAAAATLCVVLGLALPYFLRGLWQGAEGAMFTGTAIIAEGASLSPFLIALSLVAVVICAWLIRSVFGSRKIRLTDTWDCGSPLTSRMEYTATAFSAPPRFFFRALALPWKKITDTPVVSGNEWVVQKKLEHGTQMIAEKFLYRPVGRVLDGFSNRVKRMQNGIVQFYLALIFVALVVTLIVAL